MGLHRSCTLAAMELLILRLSAAGLLTHEVAEHLGISPDEARRRMAAVMDALGARSKLEAVVLALRLGLIDPPGG